MAFGVFRTKLAGQAKNLINTGISPVAIDFGTGTLKVLQVDRSETECTLVSAACLETPEDLLHDPAKRLRFQSDALPKMLKAGDFKGKRGVCAIPASLSFCKHLKVPKDGTPIGAIVEASLVQQFGCHPSQMVFRHFEVADLPSPGGGQQTEVICLAATRELVGRLMGTLREAKLEPVGMHCEQVAMLRAFDPISRRADDKNSTTLYLDIGAGSTNMLIAQGQNLMFSKRIEMGGRFLDEVICKQTKCTMSEARKLRADLDGIVLGHATAPAAKAASFLDRPVLTPAGAVPVSGTTAEEEARARSKESAERSTTAAAIAAAERRQASGSAIYSGELGRQAPRAFVPPKADLTEPLEIMTDDIALALRYYASLFPARPVERTVFVGGEARYRGLCQHIARAIRASAQIADPLASVVRGKQTTPGVDLRQPQPGWAVPLGLCLLPTDL
jgi:type IV pilus assembly protein PilM